MLLIGITGTIGAGKGTVVEYLLEKKGFKHYAVSDDFLAGEAERRGLEPTRINRRDIANEYRAKSPTALMEAVYADAKAKKGEDGNIIIDPQHTKAEVEFVKDMGGIELAIDADLPIRYERIKARGSVKDNVTYEQFVEEQTHEMVSDDPNKNNLAAAIEAADHYILNNGTREELYAQLDELCGKLGIA